MEARCSTAAVQVPLGEWWLPGNLELPAEAHGRRRVGVDPVVSESAPWSHMSEPRETEQGRPDGACHHAPHSSNSARIRFFGCAVDPRRIQASSMIEFEQHMGSRGPFAAIAGTPAARSR